MNNLVKHVPRNEIGRDFVVGDIHGCFDALRYAMFGVVFDESKDRLFSVGDLVDRGNQSEESIDWIAQPWFHAVRGNHEEMAIGWSHGEWQLIIISRMAENGSPCYPLKEGRSSRKYLNLCLL